MSDDDDDITVGKNISQTILTSNDTFRGYFDLSTASTLAEKKQFLKRVDDRLYESTSGKFSFG